jgi:hypothetical protein
MMTAKEFYNSRAIKHQLKRAIKHDKQYFEDAIIELMEMYAQEQVKNLTIPDVVQQSEQLCRVCKTGRIDNDYGCTNHKCKCYPFQ